MNPTAIIAEDEPVLRLELAELLGRLWPELRIAATASNGIEAVRVLDEHRPEVVFLDIHMPEISGLDVARHASGKSHVVFITAFDQYAIDAFEQGAVDYVLKPLDAARLMTTIERVKGRLASTPSNLDGLVDSLAEGRARRAAGLRWISASQGNDVFLVAVEEILFFQADSKYTRVVTPERELLIRKPIKELADALDAQVFWQVHRSTIVNVNAIAVVHRNLGGNITLKLKQHSETLPVSQAFAHLFRQM